MFELMQQKNSSGLGLRPWFRVLCLVVLLTFGTNVIGPDLLRVLSVYAQTAILVPPGMLLPASPISSLPTLRAISIDPTDPFKINFVVDAQNHATTEEKEVKRLTQYFLTFLTMPEKDLWVNLSPYESRRIITSDLEQTIVGKDMLIEDYFLKQLAASLTYPERELGKKFWEQVSEKIRKKYGEIDFPFNTFSKVWVVPDKAVVYEQDEGAFISESRLKVMLEEDYLSMKKNASEVKLGVDRNGQINRLYSTIAREIIIPELEREVNEGQYFAQLRQMFNSLILAIWFKRKLKDHIVNLVYTDQKKIDGIKLEEQQVGEKVYTQYLEAMKKGVYSIIHEDYDPNTQEIVSRKYFSGGFSLGDSSRWFHALPVSSFKIKLSGLIRSFGDHLSRFSVSLIPLGMSKQTLIASVMAAGLLASPISAQAKTSNNIVLRSRTSQVVQMVGNQLSSVNIGNAVAKVPVATNIQISHDIVSRGDIVPLSDQKYFAFMKSFLTLDDVNALIGKTNALDGKKYDFDQKYMKRNWEKLFLSSRYDWPQEVLVLALQEKLGIQADGDFGPETRRTLEEKMNKIDAVSQNDRESQDIVDNSDHKDKQPEIKPKAHAQVQRGVDKLVGPDEFSGIGGDGYRIQKVNLDIPQTQGSLPPKEEITSPSSHLTKEEPGPMQPSVAENKLQNLPQQTTDAGVSHENAEQSFQISTETAAVPDEITLKAQTAGIVSDLDESKREYQKGERHFKIIKPEIVKQKKTLADQLDIARLRRDDLKRLQTHQAATVLEINRAEEKIHDLEQQLAQIDQQESVVEVTAPADLLIKNILVSNGTMVRKGEDVLSYFNGERIRVTVDLPTTKIFFGRVRDFKIDGERIENIVSIDWQLNPQKTKAIVTFVVTPTSKILTNKTVKVEATILPPNPDEDHLHSIVGQAQTIAHVRKIEERVLVSPAVGKVDFYVHEGDKVTAGQVSAEVENGPYWEEFRQTILAYNDVQTQLNQTATDANGVQYILRDQQIELQNKKVALWAKLLSFQSQFSHLQVIVPENGIVTSVSSLRSSSFHEGDEILRLKTGRVFIGDVNDMEAAILLPKILNLGVGDPVVVEIPSGERLAARITTVNKTPMSPNANLGEVQAVEIMVYDTDDAVWKNFPVKVIVPSTTEKPIVLADLDREDGRRKEAEKRQAQELSRQQEKYALVFQENAPVIPLPPPKTQQVRLKNLQPSDSGEGQPLSLVEVNSQVAGNNLLHGDLTLDVVQKKAAEELPNSTRISLSAGMFVNGNGKLSYSGGLNGIFQGVMAGISTGNAYSAAIPVVFGISGEIMDLISHKKLKEQTLALKMTEIAQHHMEEAVVLQVHQATILWFDIARAQRHMADLQSLIADLENSQKVITDREAATGVSVTSDVNAVKQKIDDSRLELLDWQDQKREWTNKLNYLRGVVDQEVSATLSWNQEFLGISAQQEQDYLQSLIADESKNYRLKEGKAALEAVDLTIKLQELEYLPSVDLHGLFISDVSQQGYNPIYDYFSGTVMRSSVLTQGGNDKFNFEILLIDTGREARKTIVNAEKEKTEIYFERIQAELRRELIEAITKMRDLNAQISLAQQALMDAHRAWAQKARRSDLYSSDQLIDERIKMAKAQGQLIDLKAEYFKEKSRLVKLQVLEQDEFQSTMTQPSPKTFQEPSSTVVSVHQGQGGQNIHARAEKLLVVPVEADNAPKTVSKSGDSILSAGNINFPSVNGPNGPDGADLWVLMSAPIDKQFDLIRKILTEDPNIMTRRQVLDFFLQERQNDRRFFSTLEQVIFSSSYPDVVQRLLLSMADRQDKDIRFFIHVIDRASREKKFDLVGWGFQMLSDIFTDDPTIFQKLSEINLNYPSQGSRNSFYISTDVARRVLLDFLIWAPDDSMAKARLLQSNYWTADQLAQIYYRLKSVGSGKSDELAQLFYDEIFRRKALENINEVYSLGPFENISFPRFESDIYARFMIQEMAKANRNLLMISPDWKKYTSPELFQRAERATEDLLSSHKSTSAGSPPLDAFSVPSLDENSLLAYFQSLNIEAQKIYIAKTQSISELARIFASPTSLRGLALERLMKTSQGRLLVLEIYLKSKDKELLGLVKTHDWIDVLNADIKTIDNPAAMDIVRRALEKMKKDWALNERLSTYTFPELHTATDPREGNQAHHQINLVATDLAVRLLKENVKFHTHLLRGQEIYTPEEVGLMSEITQRIDSAHNPEELDQYLDSLRKRHNRKISKTLQEILNWRDKIAKRIAENDQSVPKVTFKTKFFAGIIGLFTLSFIPYLLKRYSRKYATVEDMIKQLREEFIPDYTNEKQRVGGWRKMLPWFPGHQSAVHHTEVQEPVITISEGSVDDVFYRRLENWRNLVNEWTKDGADPQVMSDQFNIILNNAFDIIRLTPYTPDLMWNEGSTRPVLNEKYDRILKLFNSLAIDTLNVLNNFLQNGTVLNDYQKQNLLRDINVLVQMMEYVSTYLRVLEYRGVIDKVMNYKFPDGHWTERAPRIYPFLRLLLLYSQQWKWAERGLKRELPNLLQQGNRLMPNLYLNDEVVVQQSEGLLKSATQGAHNLISVGSKSMRMNHKMRSFISRLRALFPIAGAIVGILGLFGVIGISTAISITGILAATWGFMAFWVPHINIMQMAWSRTMNTVIDKLETSLKINLGASQTSLETDGNGHPEEKIVGLAIRRGQAQLKKELDPKNKPSVDMVVIIPENLRYVESLKEYADNRRGKIFRNDVPVEVLSQKLRGSGNLYFEALEFVRQKLQDEEFKKRYPRLASMPWQDARVMFVFHGNNVAHDDHVLDWSVINGYSISSCMDGSCADPSQNQPSPLEHEQNFNRGGHILVYSRDAYFGPIPQISTGGDITLLTDWVNGDDLRDLGFVHLGFAPDGFRVREILEKLDIRELERINNPTRRLHPNPIFNFLKERYDLGNSFLKQFPALTGMMVFGPRTVDVLGRVLDQLETKHELWEQLPYLHLTSDILAVLVKPEGENMERYTDNRIGRRDVNNNYADVNARQLSNNFQAFYSLLLDARQHSAQDFVVNALLPYPGSAKLTHISSRADVQKVRRNIVEQQNAPVTSSPSRGDKAMLGEENGGIDFSGAQNNIKFEKNDLPSPANLGPTFSPPPPQPLQLFQGFKFEILGFHSLKNSHELLSLMSLASF